MNRVTLTMAVLAAATAAGPAQPLSSTRQETEMTKPEPKFYCNTSALSPSQSAGYKKLTHKLLTIRKEIVESEKGYEFQFDPGDITLAEIAEWVAAESKCCPFFDFHIDLENDGHLLCLRLSGPAGVKRFIAAEFQIPVR
jgi:hypothetical protein